MSYPTIYDVSYSYTGFQASLGDGSFPGTQLDADMAGLSDSIASIEAFIQTAFRSDGVLKAASLPGTDPILQYVDEAATAAAAEATETATAAATSASSSATNAATSETQAASSASAAQTARTGAETAQTAAAASAAASAAAAAVFDPSSYLSKSGNLAGLADKAAARANLALATVAASGAYGDLSGKPALGSAASKDVGTAAGQLVELLAGGKLPAVDGSLLTGILAGGIKNVRLITASGSVTPSAGTTKWVGFIVDGGAQGGGSGGSSLTTAGNGGSGGKGSVFVSPVSPSSTYPVTIGAVGGATSVVINGTTYTSTNGLLNVPARPGDSAMPLTAVRGGRGGDGPFGLGGGGPGASSPTGAGDVAGGAATGYGAGGGGSAKGSTAPNSYPASGAGAPGCLWLWEFQ